MPLPEISASTNPSRPGPQIEEVVVIPANQPGLDADAEIVERLEDGCLLRQEFRLHFPRDLELAPGDAFGLQPLGNFGNV